MYGKGRGAKPEYSYWDGKKYAYVPARKKIYCQIYSKAVEKTLSYKKLLNICETNKKVYLVDFDGKKKQNKK